PRHAAGQAHGRAFARRVSRTDHASCGVRRSRMIQRLLPFATLAALFTGLAIASPHFLTGPNLSTVVRQTAVINIMALGMTLIIISGAIDLSVGSILAFAGFIGTRAIAQG